MAQNDLTLIVLPLQDYPITENDRITLPWSRFLTALARAAGGGIAPDSPSVVLKLVGGFLVAYNAVTGVVIGTIPLANQPGGAAQLVVVTGSPQTYTSISDGNLVVFAAGVELSRDNGATWYQVTLQGGSIPMKKGDMVRVTWFGQNPTITWFPNFQE